MIVDDIRRYQFTTTQVFPNMRAFLTVEQVRPEG
jgi:hypothetical protein